MSKQNRRSADNSMPLLDVYGFVSRLGDSRMRSVDGQVADSCRRVEQFGGRVGEILTDPGRSAWKASAIRSASPTQRGVIPSATRRAVRAVVPSHAGRTVYHLGDDQSGFGGELTREHHGLLVGDPCAD